MADTKVSALTAAAAALGADEFPVNEAGTSKKVTITQLVTYLQTLGMPRVKKTAIHSNSTTTGTEVTDLTTALEVGTYVFDYYLILRAATAANAPLLGVNFTGTAAVKSMIMYWGDASGSLLAEAHNMDDQGVQTTGLISGMVNKTYTTTAPNMGTTVGMATAAADTYAQISGLLVVTVTGNLALWHSTRVATASTVEAGSSLVVVRTA
jgi:hypothetical protein